MDVADAPEDLDSGDAVLNAYTPLEMWRLACFSCAVSPPPWASFRIGYSRKQGGQDTQEYPKPQQHSIG